MFCGDGIRVVHPLFREEGDGSTPISPLQLHVAKMPLGVAVILNNEWHSRLPEIANPHSCEAYGATFANRYYAVALWGPPVAREFNGRGIWELRRMAIAADAPKNTGSRMLRVMRLLIRRERSDVTRLISYQDTEVHAGTIYRASGWVIGRYKPISKGDKGWNSRERNVMQSRADKIRWDCQIRMEPTSPSAHSVGTIKGADLFDVTADQPVDRAEVVTP